ncbi:hypothetical protein [Amycolatopsis sp. cg9]|uniref:hypothetical protein n=1 Tax=Amycolatopsis sp. cg9 TaxID=3238801 RepID=UPI003525F08F
MTATTPETVSTDQRLATLAKVREILPDIDAAQATAIAAWAISGSMPLDPDALNAAGKRLAQVSGLAWDMREVANDCRGKAAEVIGAYYAAAHRP